jgi:malate synthase
MSERVEAAGLQIAKPLYELINREAIPGTGVDADAFWQGLAAIVGDLGPRNAALLERREALQARIDQWHRDNPGRHADPAYRAFLEEIGYLEADPGEVAVTTANVDREVAEVAGPQLVVPVNNARYALNAANARWGSLYDALYGTDVIPEADGAEKTRGFNPERGRRVVAWAAAFLDVNFPGWSPTRPAMPSR